MNAALFIDPSTGKMRIGYDTTNNSVYSALSIYGPDYDSNISQLFVADTAAYAEGQGGAITLGGKYTTTSEDKTFFGKIAGLKANNTGDDLAGYLAFYTRPTGPSTSFIERMRIAETGDIGIGTTNPTEKLEVNGTVKATSFEGDGSQLTGMNVISVPVGTILAWAKDIPGVPLLPDGFVECNGQTLNDTESLLNGTVIPDLNGIIGVQRFLRGSESSGNTGGSESHNHGSRGLSSGMLECATTNDANHLPPYYEVVWIMRVK